MDGVHLPYQVLAQVISRRFKLTKKIKIINGSHFLFIKSWNNKTGDFAMWFTAAKMKFQLAKWHTCACRWFRKERLISQLQNFRSTLHGCLQITTTSSFELWFVHRLKCWTPEFPSFKTTYSIHKMNSRKCLKCVLQLLSSWISSC